MKKRILSLALALAVVMTTAATVPAWAALAKKTIEVYTGASIYIDGVELQPTDANGNPVETFVYNGTTYVPLRAVSQSLGKSVNWDGANQRVYIGEVPGERQYLLTVCPPYQTDCIATPSTITMAGKKYANCIIPGTSSGYNYALFNLDGQYSTLSFDLGHIDGGGMNECTLNIYLDGELSFSTDMTGEMLPTHFDVPLYNALQMKIETRNAWGRYGMGNVEIY